MLYILFTIAKKKEERNKQWIPKKRTWRPIKKICKKSEGNKGKPETKQTAADLGRAQPWLQVFFLQFAERWTRGGFTNWPGAGPGGHLLLCFLLCSFADWNHMVVSRIRPLLVIRPLHPNRICEGHQNAKESWHLLDWVGMMFIYGYWAWVWCFYVWCFYVLMCFSCPCLV